MPVIDFDELFLTADDLRHAGKIDEAINAYKEIAAQATEDQELLIKAAAFHLAGVAARKAIVGPNSSYARDAINYFEQAAAIYRTLGQEAELGAVYRDLAIGLDAAERFDDARENYEKSLLILGSQSEERGQLGISYVKFGLHYYLSGDYQRAEDYINKGLTLLKQEPEKSFFQATAMYDLARVKAKYDQIDEAIDLAEESLSWFEADHGRRRYILRLAELHGLLSILYYRRSETRKAKDSARAFNHLIKTLPPIIVKVIMKELEKSTDQDSPH